jgi:hypothetical protein
MPLAAESVSAETKHSRITHQATWRKSSQGGTKKNAINENKITIIRFHTNAMSPFRGFGH